VKAFRKVYFIDPLVARLAHLKSSSYQVPDDTKLSEQQVGLALARAVEREAPRSFVESQSFFYEVANSKVIDFVGPHLKIPFESKYTDSKLKFEAGTAKGRYGCGVLATRTVLDTGNSVWQVPAAMLAWLLG
jgi:predicted AAA+ superfamily ATPase